MDQKNLIKFLGFWIVNAILLSIFSSLYARDVALGNASVAKPAAATVNSLILAIVVYFVPDLIKKLDLKLKISDEKVLLVGYFLADFVALWVLKRLADFTGLGIGSILHVLVIAVVLSLVQVGVKRYSSKLLKKN
ncbi:hypothetical protein A3J17_03440 [Candidatus Curtissbacteria bacterium RIFCSPLOWO2_02_FULL_40_11]|nr:MAG: hypothetical protein A3J17_03440 [Candidatus Curtissbacteria bacterium RIFCSPLOWO2_02_FULL_40_11]OGE14145.1 MAG: hypothetical protein A3G14_02470 [Candidatus Curtissbacteria bacterium RIFCSPLOWO2_12_FULL_38_9]